MSSQPDSPGPPPAGQRRRRGCWAIGLLVVGLVAGLTLLPLGPLHGLIRGTLVRVLQEQTGRQVEVGPLRGLLWTGLRVDGLRIAEEGGFARGSLVAVERIRLGWNLLALLFHRDEPLRALNAITVESPNIVVRRQADGVWELARLLQPKTPRPKTPFRFGGTITLRDARLRVIDEVAEKTGYSLAQIIEDVDLEARFDGQGDARFTFSARDAEVADQIIIRNGRIALLAPSYTRIASIDAELDARGLRLDAGAKIINVFLARWAVLHGGQITSLRGPLSLRLVDTAPGAKEAPVFDVGLALTAQLRNLDAEVRAFGKPFREVDGTLGIEMVRRDGQGPGRRDRITVTAGRGMAGSTPVRVDGAINDFRQRLSFDLRVRSDALVVGEIANALPKIPALRPLRGYGTSRVDVGVSGQLTNLRLYGWAQPGGVGWGDWATVAGGLVRFDLRRTPPNQGLAGLAGRLELNNVSGRTRFVNAPLRRIYGQVSLGPDRLTFHRLRLLAGEAAVAVDGRIDRVTQPRRQVLALAVAASGLAATALAPLLPAAIRPLASSGGVTANLRLHGPVSALAVAGQVRLPWFRTRLFTHLGGSYQLAVQLGGRPTGRVTAAGAGLLVPQFGAPITGLHGTLVLRPQGIGLRGVRANYAGGPVAVDGSVSLDGRRFDLAVVTRGVDLAQATRLTRRQGIVGRGALTANLRLRGSLNQFSVVGQASVPWLRVPGATIRSAALSANLSVQPRLGLAGLRGSVTAARTHIAATALKTPLYVERGHFLLSPGRVVLAPVSGRINGDPFTARGSIRLATGRRLRVSSVDLAVRTSRLRGPTIRALAGNLPALRKVRITQPVAADLRLSGPLSRLRLRGNVAVAEAVLAGASPAVVAGRARLDLVLRRGAPPLGTAYLTGGTVRLDRLGAPLQRIAGQLRFASDGRVYLGQPGGAGLTGRLGESAFAVRGSVGLGRGEPDLNLTLTFERLRVADLRAAAAGLEQPPEIGGEGELGTLSVRITGRPSRLRIASEGPRGEPGGLVALPPSLTVAGYRIEGGTAALDLLVVKGRLSDGRIDLRDVAVTAEQSGTRVAVETGLLRVADGQLAQIELDATVAGRPVKVAGNTRNGELNLRVQATDVNLFGLLPKLGGLSDQLASNLVSSDLTVVGPLADLAVVGKVAVGGAADLEPLQAEVHLRVVEPLPDPEGGRRPRQILGGVQLTGGHLAIATLAEPVSDIRGTLTFSSSDVLIDRLSATVAGTPVVLSGSVYGLPGPVFDLALDLPGADLGRLAAATRLPPPGNPEGDPVDLFTALALPVLHTPEPVSGRITLLGPQEQVAVGVDLAIPLVTVDPAYAMPEPRGLGANDPLAASRGSLLFRDGRISGTAVGSLARPLALLPDQGELAAALGELTGLTLVAETAATRAAEEPPAASILDSFVLALKVESQHINPRQGFSFTSEAVRTGFLEEAYAFQPAAAVLNIIGPASSPELRGQFDLTRLELQGIPVRRLAAGFDYFDRILTLNDIAMAIRDGALRGHGAMALVADQPVDLAMELRIENIELAVLNQLDPAQERDLELDGLINGGLQLHLAEEIPRLRAALEIAGVAVNGERLGDLQADVGVEEKMLVVRRLALEDPAGATQAHAKGRVALTADGPIDLVADVQNLELGRLAPLFETEQPPITGQLDLVASVGGTRRLPMVTGTGNVFFGSIQGLPFNRLSLRSVQTDPDSLRLTAELTDAAYRVTARADLDSIDLTTGELSYRADLDIASVELSEALPLASGSASLGGSFGEVTGSGEFTGRVARRTDETGRAWLNPLVDLDGYLNLAAGDPTRPGRLQVGGLELDTARLRLRAANEVLRVEELEVVRGATRLGIDPNQPNRIANLDQNPTVELHLTSDELHYEDVASLTGVALQTTGHVTVTADISGPLRDPVTELRVTTHDLTIAGEEIGDRVVSARIARGMAVIEGTQVLEVFGLRMAFGGYVDQAGLQSNIDLEITDFERFRTFLLSLTQPVGDRRPLAWQTSLRNALASIPQPMEGNFRATVRLAGSRERPNGFLTASLRDAVAGGRVVPPAEVAVNIGTPQPRQPASFDPGVLYLFGSVQLGRQADGGALRLQLRTSDFDLAPLAAWSPGLEGLQGRLSTVATGTGSFRDPRIEVLELGVRNVGMRNLNFAALNVRQLVWQPGTLDLGEITVVDGSLTAGLTGSVSLLGRGFQLRDDGPLDVHLAADVRDVAEFREIVPGLGEASGQARLELELSGTPRTLLASGLLEADLPRLQLVDDESASGPRHGAQIAPTLADVTNPATAVVLPEKREPGRVLYNLVDTQVRLALEENTLRVDRFYVGALPPEGGATRGELEILAGGTVALPRPLNVAQMDEQSNLLGSPIDLQIRARDFAGRSGPIEVAGLQLAIDVDPVFEGGILNRINVQQGEGWVNGGFVRMAGNVGLRNADPRAWGDHLYNVSLTTPVVALGSVSPADGGTAPVPRGEGVVYPLLFDRGAIGEGRATLDLQLVTREGQTPPLTLIGRVDLFDAIIREGALALFAGGGGDKDPKPWPASPAIDLVVDARENNWIRARVPDLQVPFRATARLSDTPQQLKVEGNAELGEGALVSSLLTNRINVRGGQAQFTLRRNPVRGAFEPFASFSARAETTITEPIGGGDVQRYQVTMNVRGSARPGTARPVETEFVIDADSNPPLPEERIFAMLSRRAEFAQALESGEVERFLQQELTNAALQTALSYALTPVFEELRQALGLDVFTVRYELDQPLEIQASKYLLKRLFLTLFVEVGGTTGTKQTVKLDYEVTNGVRFGVQFDTEGDFRIHSEYSTKF